MINFIPCKEVQLQCQSDVWIRCQELKEPIFLSKWNIKFKVALLIRLYILSRQRGGHNLFVYVIAWLGEWLKIQRTPVKLAGDSTWHNFVFSRTYLEDAKEEKFENWMAIS